MTISGHVLDSSGKQAARATVQLHRQSSDQQLETTADASGAFSFRGLGFGDYILNAEKAGARSPNAHIILTKEDSQENELILGASVRATAEAAPPEMEFSDKAEFTVAGVTDWTAVGGHGSDATLRTSEDLALETRSLKRPSGPGDAPRPQGASEDEARLQAALALNPQSYTANHAVGQYYLRAGKYEQAIPPLQAALAAGGGKAEDEYNLARACRGIGDTAQALQHIQRALAQKDLADFHRLAGELNEEAGDPLAAVQELERATLLEPKEENYFAWGSELLLHRAVREAAQVFQNGAKAHPGSARMKTGWGTALFASALYDQAAQQLCQASDLNPDDTESYLVMGKVDLASPSPLACIENKLARFLSSQPRNADATFLASRALAKRDSVANQDRILTLLAKTVALDPNYADAHLQLGILAFAQKRYHEAVTFYQRAIAANPRLAEAHYRLGVAYDRIGDATSARQELRLHDELQKAEADAVEAQRRKIKQFVVVPHSSPVMSQNPTP